MVLINKESELEIESHVTVYEKYNQITLEFKNFMMEIVFEYYFREKIEGTEIEYRCDIKFRHIFGWVFNPFFPENYFSQN